MTLAERITRGEDAIARAKAEGRDVADWEAHLEMLRREAVLEELPPRAEIIEQIRAQDGTLRALHVCSYLFETHLWVLIDESFFPDDNDPVFFFDELVFLKSKDPQEIKSILEVKRVFPRARVLQ